MSTLLGLANAGQSAVTGAAAVVGFGDSAWCNYDEAFVVSAELSTVKGLVWAEQKRFRQEIAPGDKNFPGDLQSAQLVIQEYADICSTLGMKSLLSQGAELKRQEITENTEAAEQSSGEEAPDEITEDG